MAPKVTFQTCHNDAPLSILPSSDAGADELAREAWLPEACAVVKRPDPNAVLWFPVDLCDAPVLCAVQPEGLDQRGQSGGGGARKDPQGAPRAAGRVLQQGTVSLPNIHACRDNKGQLRNIRGKKFKCVECESLFFICVKLHLL